MQPTQPPLRTVFLPKNISQKRLPQPAKHSDFRMTTSVVDEINAYAGIGDIALPEAEKEPTFLILERARMANDLVKDGFKQAGHPTKASICRRPTPRANATVAGTSEFVSPC